VKNSQMGRENGVSGNFLEFKNSQKNRKTVVSPLKHFRGRDQFCAQCLTLARRRLVLPPALDPLLCGKSSGLVNYRDPSASAASGGGAFDNPDTRLSGFEGTYILVLQGRCSFELKARSTHCLGALGVVVRNTLDLRYEPPPSADGGMGGDGEATWPAAACDYECGDRPAAGGFGFRAEVNLVVLDLAPPPVRGQQARRHQRQAARRNWREGQPLRAQAVSGNEAPAATFESRCPGGRCLLTGHNGTLDRGRLEACCAWDLLLDMGDVYGGGGYYYNDGDAVLPGDKEPITISPLFVTMEKGGELRALVADADAENAVLAGSVGYVGVVVYGRWRPPTHYLAALLWALAVCAIWASAAASARKYGER
jgi:hypothetical protein